MRRFPGRPLIACALALVGALLAAAPAQASGLVPVTPRSPNAETIVISYWAMLAIAALLVVAVNVALIAAVVGFRARRDRRAVRAGAGRGALRPAVAGLSLLALAVLAFGVVMTVNAREVEESGPAGLESALAQTAQVGVTGVEEAAAAGDPPAEDADPAATAPLEIGVIGQRWMWRFEYPGGQPGQRIFSYGELVVPVDTTVILDITSIDVSHGWWVPALGGQVQALPGSSSRTWFRAEREGRYAGRSTIFSGTGFPYMRAWVRVVSAEDYLTHLDELESDLRAAQAEIERSDQEGS